MADPAEYRPEPIDIAAVATPPHFEPLLERLAENAHEVWAEKRIAEGWRFGAEKDSDAQTTPFLVPYAALPESEKETDRAIVRNSLLAAIQLGARVEPPVPPMSREDLEACVTWKQSLERSLDEIEKGTNTTRAGNFDMDDAPELVEDSLRRFPRLRAALAAFQQHLHPAWARVDAEAMALQRAHRIVAWRAIVPGVGAIVLAILQLALPSEHVIARYLPAFEAALAVIAVWYVAKGFKNRTRDRWLAKRQAAERLRLIKFKALADESLWRDTKAWFECWNSAVAALAQNATEPPTKAEILAAKTWVTDGGGAPHLPEPLTVAISAGEARALACYYRHKRQRFQERYFARRAQQHEDETWALRLQFPVILFFASVLFVLAHVALELVAHPSHALVTTLVTLAAVLPVIGFGLRAWFSAFEIPRRAHLFASKAKQLEKDVQALSNDEEQPRRVLTHIELGEHFFENEHREWCRLILEAEWFV